MKRIITLLLIATLLNLNAQDVTIQGTTLPQKIEYSVKYDKYELFDINVEEVRKAISSSAKSSIEIDLILGQKSHYLQLNKYNLFRPDSKVRVSTATGVIDVDPDPSIESYRGFNANFGGSEASMTIAKNYLSIMFREGEETYYLEQVKYDFNNADENKFILYSTNGYRAKANFKTLPDEVHELTETQVKAVDPDLYRNAKCYEIVIALAADSKFFQTYSSNRTIAEARLVTIINLMQTDWVAPKLLYDYIWGIGPLAIFEDPLRDPFASAGSVAAMQSTLASIAPGIFFGGFAIATAWTTKFTSAPYYAAGQGSACTLSPYTACTEFTRNDGVIRSLSSHTIGHTLGAVHDAGGSGYIMAPEINGSSNWSPVSQIAILEGTKKILGCLVDCSGSQIPVAEFMGDPVEGCLPIVVNFTNMSKNGTSFKWSFPGGTPSSSTLKVPPPITYISPGSYAVELQVMNAKCTTKVEKLAYIYVKDKPRSVRFNFGAANSGNDIEFFASSDRADLYQWKFPDGSTDEGEYIIHTFDKEGNFDVELCASNDCGQTCVKQKVSNFYAPMADFSSDTTAGCAPKTIKFFDQSSTNVVNWTWSFPGGTPNGSFIKNPTIKYTRPGKYPVKLVVNSLKNNAQIVRDTFITIDSLPLAQFDPTIAGPVVTMNSSTYYAKTHFWDFGDGTTNKDSSPVHVFRDGRFEITYTATNGCGKTVVKKTVTIGNKPTAGFAVEKQNGCIPYLVKFQNKSTASATRFLWSFPGGNPSSSTDKEPTVLYNSIGKYDVKLVAYGAVESDSLTSKEFITVNEGPTADFQLGINGFVANFTNQSKNASNYYWDFGDGKSSTSFSPTHNYGVEGEFTVKLITENECGIDTSERMIAIYLIPKVNFNSNVIKGCAPLTVQFNDQSSIDVTDWSWQFESGVPSSSTLKNPKVTFDKAGKYTVKLSVKNSNGTNSSTKLKYIEVLSPIKCPRKPPRKQEGTPNGDELENFNGKVYARAVNENEVSIYPNPATDELFIEAKPGTHYSFISMSGIPLLKGKTSSKITKLDLSKYSMGTYLLKVDHTEFNEVIKIVINN